ncbi:MAG TPA: MFS transporter [Cellulomonas sp.]
MTVDESPRTRPAAALIALVLASAVVLLGTTILNVALPEMTSSLHLSNTAQQWVLNSYTLTFAGFLLLAGAVGDRFGLRKTLIVGLVGFALTSALASLPLKVGFIIAMRALMGVFAAAILPTTLAIILRTFPPERRASAVAVWAAASGVAISAGPLIGGALLSAGLWWGSVLVVIAVMAVIALPIALVGVPQLPAYAGSRLRVVPVLASVCGIALVVWGVLNGGEDGRWLSASTLAPLVAGVVVLAGLVVTELRSANPVADVRLFRRLEFTIPVIALGLGSFVVFGYMYFTTFYLQVEHGYTPFQTGLIFIPLSVGLVLGSPLSRTLVTRMGARAVMATGLFLTALAMAGLFLVNGHSSVIRFLADLFMLAFGFALVLSPGTTLAMSAVPPERVGSGSALLNTMRQLASALGVAILGSILWSSYRGTVLPDLDVLPDATRETAAQSLSNTLAAASGDAEIITAAKAAFDAALHLTSSISAGLAILAAIAVLAVRPGRPREELR